MEAVWLSDEVAFSDQPAQQDLKRVRQLGVRTLVNVRLPREQPAGEAPWSGRTGLNYVRIPTASVWDIGEEQLDELLRLASDPDALPLLVHSAEGARAGVMALALAAVKLGWPEAVLEGRARRLGLELSPTVHDWVRRRLGMARELRPPA